MELPVHPHSVGFLQPRRLHQHPPHPQTPRMPRTGCRAKCACGAVVWLSWESLLEMICPKSSPSRAKPIARRPRRNHRASTRAHGLKSSASTQMPWPTSPRLTPRSSTGRPIASYASCSWARPPRRTTPFRPSLDIWRTTTSRRKSGAVVIASERSSYTRRLLRAAGCLSSLLTPLMPIQPNLPSHSLVCTSRYFIIMTFLLSLFFLNNRNFRYKPRSFSLRRHTVTPCGPSSGRSGSTLRTCRPFASVTRERNARAACGYRRYRRPSRPSRECARIEGSRTVSIFGWK